MVRLYKRKGCANYYIDVSGNGFRKRISTGTPVKAEAQKIAARYADYEPAPEASLGRFIRLYLDYSLANKAHNTYRADRLALKNFRAFVGEHRRLAGITRFDVEKYKIQRLSSVSPSTVNHELRHLKAALNMASKWKLIDKVNPFSGVKKIKDKKGDQPLFLAQAQINSLLAAMEGDPRFRFLVEFYLYTGGRRSEVLSLYWEDISFEPNPRVQFRGAHTKSGKPRSMPLHPNLVGTLRKMQGKPTEKIFNYNLDYVTKQFKSYCRKAGLPEFVHLHMLRHTFASHLVIQGVGLPAVKELLGHSSITTTMIYAHLSPDHLNEAVRKLTYGL